jgi:hypothetical protein
MTPDRRVEYLNIGLMLAALAAAAALPFEVFLVSYAVLGPLHYATEISWLHDRRYFALRAADCLPLLACAALITLGNQDLLGTGSTWLNRFQLAGTGLAELLKSVQADVTFFAFGAALVLVLTSQTSMRMLGLALVAVSAILFHAGSGDPSTNLYLRLFSIYLPTLIHVFVFTGIFILAGALKRGSAAGYASLGVFLACAALAVWLPNLAAPSHTGAPAVYWRGFHELSFAGLNDLMGRSSEDLVGTNVYTNDLVMRFVRFLAFAYTYHYLNWFSKTSIIQWHLVSRPRLLLVAAVWIASVALYAVNFELGLRWLFLLSLAHVVLEFPLNHRSFLEIGGQLRRRLVAAGP